MPRLAVVGSKGPRSSCVGTLTHPVPSALQADAEPLVTSGASEVVPRVLSGEPQSLCSCPTVVRGWVGGWAAPWPALGHCGGLLTTVERAELPGCSPWGGVCSVTCHRDRGPGALSVQAACRGGRDPLRTVPPARVWVPQRGVGPPGALQLVPALSPSWASLSSQLTWTLSTCSWR